MFLPFSVIFLSGKNSKKDPFIIHPVALAVHIRPVESNCLVRSNILYRVVAMTIIREQSCCKTKTMGEGWDTGGLRMGEISIFVERRFFPLGRSPAQPSPASSSIDVQ